METKETETQGQRALQKLKENPGIPLGFVATCYALGMAFKRMQQRDSAGYQRWLRARVLAQGVTVVAIVYAGVKEWDKFSTTSPGALAAAANAATEHRAFEERLRAAEESHGAAVLGRTSAPQAAAGLGVPPVAPSPEAPLPPKNTGAAPGERRSWLSWIGLSRG